MFGPVGTKIGPTGISTVTVIGPDSAEKTREEVRCKESQSFRTRLAARLTKNTFIICPSIHLEHPEPFSRKEKNEKRTGREERIREYIGKRRHE
jgi:hypothetical protein